MCNILFVSTDSEEDLAQLTALCRFERGVPSDEEGFSGLLEYPNWWFLTGRYGGCSCGFRHQLFVREVECVGFGEPEDWCPEDPEDVEDTSAAYDVLSRLVGEGHKVDVVDLWNGEADEGVKTLTVSMSEIGRTEFKFFENHRFVLVP